MMRSILDRILKINRYESVLQRSRAAMIYTLLAIMVGFVSVYALFVPQWGDTGEQTLIGIIFSAGIINEIVILFALFYLFSAATFLLLRSKYLNSSAHMLLLTWFVGGVWLNLLAQPLLDSAAASVAVLLLMAGLVTSWRGVMITMFASIVSLLLSTVIREPEFSAFSNLPTLIMATLAMGLVLYLFLRYFRLSLAEGVSSAIEERIKGAEIVAQLTVAASQRMPTRDITQYVAEQLIKTYPMLYQARVYLTDSDGYEVRIAGNEVRAGSNAVLQTAERANIGGLSLIGQAMSSGKPQITIQNFGVEAAFPMIMGRQTIGALNIRTQNPDYLQRGYVVEAYQLLANTIALALDASKQYDLAQQRANENRQIQEQAALAKREVERLSQRLTGGAWSQFLKEDERVPSMSIDFETDEVSQDTGWTPTLNEAATINQLVQDARGDRQVVAVPLRVRGQVIGAMEFELDESRELTPEDYELLTDISERFGLAVENTRLVKESQRIAQRETVINQISTRLQQSNDMRTAIEEAARGLRNALNAGKVSIILGEPDSTTSSNSSNGKGA